MKLKIVDKKKFARAVIVVIISILFLLTGLNRTYSKGEIKYKEEYINTGDTLWSIAKKEADTNKYYENEDIRNIIEEIKDINQMENGNLKIGQKIKIPTF